MAVRVHPTAIVEQGVTIGDGTSVWDNVHLRGPSRIGRDCIIGGKSYVAYGVEIGDLVKINAMVYICNAVTIERGVMIAAGVTFTNDLYPRATNPELTELRGSEPDEETFPTLVREGATIGARAVIGCNLEIGRFAMVGMAAVVTRSVPDFHLVMGQPARSAAYLCRCGKPWHKFNGPAPDAEGSCHHCGRHYRAVAGRVSELSA